MTDQDTIRKAVELADGWVIESNGVGGWNTKIATGNWYVWPLVQETIDALAAQLVRQYHERHPTDRLPYQNDVMETIKYVVDYY